jgi:DNA-binding transcriptional LysR family regulator
VPLIEPGEIEAFIALAEELHFGRTAERLHLSQPRVSQLIRSLERRVEARLFERTTRPVTLTPAGKFLLKRVQPLYAELSRCLEETRSFARRVRVGFLGPFAGALECLVETLCAKHPAYKVYSMETTWNDYYGPLRRAEVDAQIVVWPVAEPDLVMGPVLATYPRVLAVSARHPLAARETVSSEELADLTHVDVAGSAPKSVNQSFLPDQSPSGRPIRRGGVALTQQEMLSRVALGQEVFPTSTALTERYLHRGVVFVPIPDLEPTRAVLAWREDIEPAKAALFLEV